MSMTKMGAREYLFLWSSCVKVGADFEHVLKETTYDPHRDTIVMVGRPGDTSSLPSTFRVTREGSASCDILKKHGLTQDDIDAAVKKYLEES